MICTVGRSINIGNTFSLRTWSSGNSSCDEQCTQTSTDGMSLSRDLSLILREKFIVVYFAALGNLTVGNPYVKESCANLVSLLATETSSSSIMEHKAWSDSGAAASLCRDDLSQH